MENGKCKILWDMTIQGDQVIEATRPDIVVVKRRVTRKLLWILLYRGITDCRKRRVKRLISTKI